MAQKYVNGELVNLTSEEETQISNDISKNATENAATGYIMNRKIRTYTNNNRC